jgi:hypothetical protein
LYPKVVLEYLVTTVDLARAVAGPKTMLDFLPKLVIIIHRIVPCNEHPEGDVLDRASFLTLFNLCEDLRVPEREVFSDVFKASTLPKTSSQRNDARSRLPQGSWRSAVKEKRRSLVAPAPAVILYAVPFLGAGDRFGQV